MSSIPVEIMAIRIWWPLWHLALTWLNYCNSYSSALEADWLQWSQACDVLRRCIVYSAFISVDTVDSIAQGHKRKNLLNQHWRPWQIQMWSSLQNRIQGRRYSAWLTFVMCLQELSLNANFRIYIYEPEAQEPVFTIRCQRRRLVVLNGGDPRLHYWLCQALHQEGHWFRCHGLDSLLTFLHQHFHGQTIEYMAAVATHRQSVMLWYSINHSATDRAHI